MTQSRMIVLILLASIVSITAEQLCSLGEFKCNDGTCIPKEEQCNTYNNCAEGEDEVGCTVTSLCRVDQFTCLQNAIPTCYEMKYICKEGSLDDGLKCDNREDLENCVCDTNKPVEKPMRCPTDNKCYATNAPSWKATKFCEDCPQAKTCGKFDKTSCKADIGYKYCKSKPDADGSNALKCLPVASFSDKYERCLGEADGEKNMKPASITTEVEPPDEIYIGKTVELKYQVSGAPTPQYQIYHYNKLMTLPLDHEGASVTAVYKQTTLVDYALTIKFANINEYFYGNYDVLVWNVNSKDPIINDDVTSYRHTAVEKTVIHFAGVPTAEMVDSGKAALTDDSSVVWQTDNPSKMRCRVTGDPTPTTTFTLGDSTIEQEGGKYEIEVDADDVDISILKLVTAEKDMIGRYSCTGSSVLGKAAAKYGVNVDIIIDPVISTFTGMEEGKYFSRINGEIDIECTARGYPSIWMILKTDEGATGSFTKANADVVEDGQDEVQLLLTYKYTNNKMTVMECVARITTDGVYVTQTKTVTYYPISEPTMDIEKEEFTLTNGQPFTTTITVTFTEYLTESSTILLTAVVVAADGSDLDLAYWSLTEKDDTAANVFVFELSVDDPSIGNIGNFKVTASDTLYDIEKAFSVDVIEHMVFIRELDAELTINQHATLTLEVAVLAKPVPSSAAWTVNDAEITNDGTTTISERFDSVSYITTYTLTIAGILSAQAGIYKVVIGGTLESSITVTVVDHPCVLMPCQNGASCEESTLHDYTCTCTHDNYEGKNCETNTFCAQGKNPCDATSTCQVLPYPDNYQCNCPFSREGDHCEIVIDFCERVGDVKCGIASGNALCENTYAPDDGYVCYCKHSIGGIYCDITQLCTPNPCENGATCAVSGYDQGRTRVCECTAGWTGDTCKEEIAGHCWVNCNDRAICEEREVCLCEYPYYKDYCDEAIHDDAASIHIAARGYLQARTSPIIAEERLQKYILPLQILPMDHSCRIARMSANEDGTGDYVEYVLTKTDLPDTDISKRDTEESFSMEFYINSEISGSVTNQHVEDVTVDKIISIALAAYNSNIFISIFHSTGTVVPVRLEIDLPELPYLKLSDFEAGVGCELVLIGQVTAGLSTLNPANGYTSGRSVNPEDPCFYNSCLHGGLCVPNLALGTQSCNCADTGFTGDLCETPVDNSCDDRGCLFGGECLSDSCLCAFPFYGVLCEKSSGVTDHMAMSGVTSEIVYGNTDITSVKIKWILPESFSATDFDLLTLGTPQNLVKIFVVGPATELYMIVNRARESGAYNGLGRMTELIHNNEFHLSVSFVEEDIHISSYDGTVATDAVVITAASLPCPDGLGTIDGLVVHGIAGTAVMASATINGDIVMPMGGMGLVKTVRVEECEGGQIFKMCGKSCTPTCDELIPKCKMVCVQRCECPFSLPIWHEGQCIAIDKCPDKESSSDPVQVCERGQTWQTCARSCTPTCDNRDPPCDMECVAKCACPSSHPVTHEGECIPLNQCPDKGLCAKACGEGTCVSHNNQITCSDCPKGTNPITCSGMVCDPAACQGTCADIGECVCGFGTSGPNCENEEVFTAVSLPTTTSTYYSYLHYTAEEMEGTSAGLHFNVKVESAKTGVLAFIGSVHQYIVVKIDGVKIKAVVYCSEISQVELSVSDVDYNAWLAITIEWDEQNVKLTVNEDTDQVEAGVCYFHFGTYFCLGGMPSGMIPTLPGGLLPGVIATFAPTSHILPAGSQLVDGQSMKNYHLHVCETPFSPCCVEGTELCVADGAGYTCTCKSEFKGDHCKIPKPPCDETICSENEICADGSCICKFGFARAKDTACEESGITFKGICMEGPQGFAVIDLDPDVVANDFDFVFRFYLSADMEDGTYDLVAVTYHNEDGLVSNIGLDVSVVTETIEDKEQPEDTQHREQRSAEEETGDTTKKTFKIVSEHLQEDVILVSGNWYIIRIQTSGTGTSIEVNDVTYTTLLIKIPVAKSIIIGVVDNTAYPGCVTDIVVNGEEINELDDGAGVKSCDAKVPTDTELRYGNLVWAELGLLFG